MKTRLKLKRKAQLTMFIIVSVLIISIIIFLFYIGNTNKKMQDETNKATKTPVETSPIENFVTQCLAMTLEDSLDLIGKQGGYIYKSQGGTLIDPAEQGKDFVDYEGYKVHYLIYPPRFSVGGYSSTVPEYPWESFPYVEGEEAFFGYFGISNLPPLDDARGAHSLHKQIQTYIENNLKNCIGDFSIFKGFTIEQGDVKAYVTIGREDVSVRIDFPLEITNINTGKKTEKKDFYSKSNIRLKKIYSLIKNLVDKDIQDISFDIDDESNDIDFMDVRLQKDIFGNDDLIVIRDRRSKMKDEPYEFNFVRKNRNPAIYYFESPSLVLPPNTLVYADRAVFPNGTVYDEAIVKSPLRALDPDEDVITFSYICINTETTECNLATGNCDNFDCILNKDSIIFRVKALDNGLEDYRNLIVERSS